MKKLVLAAAVLLLACCPTLWAVSTLHIGPGAHSKCATGCAGDPNLLAGAAQVDVYQTSGGATNVGQPLLLIFGVPNNNQTITHTLITKAFAINAYPGGTISAATFAPAGAGTYGLIPPISGAFFGDMTSGEEVYSFLGLTGANNSNNFVNWSAADASIVDINATSYGVYVYAVTGTLGAQGLMNMSLWDDVPKGTIIVAYGQDVNGKVYDTPFTEAGMKCTYNK